jgi:hypothetical protein
VIHNHELPFLFFVPELGANLCRTPPLKFSLTFTFPLTSTLISFKDLCKGKHEYILYCGWYTGFCTTTDTDIEPEEEKENLVSKLTIQEIILRSNNIFEQANGQRSTTESHISTTLPQVSSHISLRALRVSRSRLVFALRISHS